MAKVSTWDRAGQMQHAEYVGGFVNGKWTPASREWKRRNAAFRSQPENAVCRAGVPLWRILFPTQTHHMDYRCGVCGTPYPYWTQLARHWRDDPCGWAPREARLGHERDDDLCSLCNFHHWLFEVILRAKRDAALAEHRKLPDRKRATHVFVWSFRFGYAGVAASLALWADATWHLIPW
jgi:hypothetical protein